MLDLPMIRSFIVNSKGFTMSSLLKTHSWVIVDNATGEAVVELFNPSLVAHVNLNKYKVVPILQYLQNLNKTLKENI